MRKEDMLKHARECRQWAATARDLKTRDRFLEAAATWETLAREHDFLDTENATAGFVVAMSADGRQRRLS